VRPRAFALGVAAIALATTATAETLMNPWDAAKDPAAAERSMLHLHVREMLASLPAAAREPVLRRARSLLEQAHAADSPDVRLRFDLGEVYASPEIDDSQRAIDVLRPALDLAPDHPGAISAFIRLANAYAKLDRSEDERRVYERFLPKVTDEVARSTALLNLAEAHMHMGELEEAVAGYKATIDLAAQLPNQVEMLYHTGALAVWGLAVALDRSGDVRGGAKEAELAVTLDRDMGIIRLNPDVFFVPARERDWYVALGFMEYAKQADEAGVAATWWARAEGCWRDYVAEARATAHGEDRWLEIARARLEATHAQRMSVQKRVKGSVVVPAGECVR
jgi:tetratricopeptide (TPR) repeat protein